MEGKEHHNEEDENLNPNSDSNEEESDADDFGLPEIENSSEESENLGDPYSASWEEEGESQDFSDNTDDNVESIESVYSDEETGQSTYYEEEYGQKKSPVGWIIFGVLLLIAIIIGVFWWMNRDTTPKETVKTITPQPVVEEPVEEEVITEVIEEPEPVKETTTQDAGVFEINEPTGRYQVIIASSIDVDLVRDYANKLAQQGMTCNILAPQGNKKFHRLSVANYASLNDATIKAEELKSTFGENVWVIRY